MTPTALTLPGLRTQPVSFYLAVSVLRFGCSCCFSDGAKAGLLLLPLWRGRNLKVDVAGRVGCTMVLLRDLFLNSNRKENKCN